MIKGLGGFVGGYLETAERNPGARGFGIPSEQVGWGLKEMAC